MVATSWARSDTRGGSYYRKKIAEDKSRKEALPQEARLRRRLQEPRGGLADRFAQRSLTNRSREFRTSRQLGTYARLDSTIWVPVSALGGRDANE
jgi:hypothetical protein